MWSQMYIGVSAMHSLFLPDFNEMWTFSTDFRKILKHLISINSFQWGSSCPCAWMGVCPLWVKFDLHLPEKQITPRRLNRTRHADSLVIAEYTNLKKEKNCWWWGGKKEDPPRQCKVWQTDQTKLIVTFRNSENAPKNGGGHKISSCMNKICIWKYIAKRLGITYEILPASQ